MKMDLALLLLAFTMLWKSSQSIRCYKCIPQKETHLDSPECSRFDYSDAFIVDCNSSTMCFKKITTLDLGNGHVTRNEERGCAMQTWEGNQKKVNGKWRTVKEIYEVYDESCKEDSGDYQRPTKAVECYCRGDLCNSAPSFTIGLVLMSTLLFYFLLS